MNGSEDVTDDEEDYGWKEDTVLEYSVSDSCTGSSASSVRHRQAHLAVSVAMPRVTTTMSHPRSDSECVSVLDMSWTGCRTHLLHTDCETFFSVKLKLSMRSSS